MDYKSLIKKFKANDYSEFNQFYTSTKKQVYFTALVVLKDNGLAEDVMQETYITFLETIDNFIEGANVFSYLTVIARNKAINIYNKNKKVTYDDDKMANVPTEMEEGNSGVMEILSHLKSDREREIVMYHVILGYKFNEISKIVSEPLGTVLWRYNKAMKTLKKEVRSDE